MNKEWLYEKIERVPPITDAEIMEMWHIEPVLASGGMYRRIDGMDKVHRRDQSFLWDAKPIGDEFTFHELNKSRIITQHHSSVFFKPSLAEVYAWIRVYMPQAWREVKFFCMDEPQRIGSSTDFMCWCDVMGGEMLVRGEEVTFANGNVGHCLVPATPPPPANSPRAAPAGARPPQ